MSLDQDLNKILKEMWRLDENLIEGVELNEDEKVFYANNLKVIQDYYEKNFKYWNVKNI